ncbi:MAG: FecR domain-containing protein, partial [Lachnospiraceae bacterium]|nr:FecR domain-containing protein [Lachnospiraceae bacterium]
MQTKLKYRLITAMLAAALMLSACGGAGGSKADGSSAGTQSENPLPDDTGTESGPELTGNKDEEKVSAAAEAKPVTEVTAVSMRLARMEGAVSLRNEDGEVLTKLQNMRLAGGNEIATAVGSRAGISLDETKAVTVGEKSHAVVERRKKDLLLDLKNGEMYFSVSRPLEEDESFEIRTSTMVMGVRGTSGYVRSGDAYTYTESGTDAAVRADDATDTIILTSGHVTLVAETGEEQEVRPGQRVDISTSGDRTEYAVTEVRPADFPDLLLLELAADEEMLDEADA